MFMTKKYIKGGWFTYYEYEAFMYRCKMENYRKKRQIIL